MATEEFDQPPLEGWTVDGGIAVALDNCVVVTEPRFQRTRTRSEWLCTIHASADLWNPDRNDTWVLHAQREEARAANSLHLRPGDRVGVKGVELSRQEVTLSGGETQILNHAYVATIQVMSRAPRVIATTYRRGVG